LNQDDQEEGGVENGKGGLQLDEGQGIEEASNCSNGETSAEFNVHRVFLIFNKGLIKSTVDEVVVEDKGHKEGDKNDFNSREI